MVNLRLFPKKWKKNSFSGFFKNDKKLTFGSRFWFVTDFIEFFQNCRSWPTTDFFDFRQENLNSMIKYSPLHLKTTKKSFRFKNFQTTKIRYPFPGQNLIKNFRILQIRSKFFNIPKPNPPPIFRNSAKIFTKISEFDDRDMIQTQVEKIIDVDEKNGKSKMVFCDLRSQRDINNSIFSIFSFLAHGF